MPDTPDDTPATLHVTPELLESIRSRMPVSAPPLERAESRDAPASVTCCCVLGNAIYAFSDIGHVYRITPNPFSVTALLTPPVGAPGAGPGPWRDFIADPGWTNVTLRYRLVAPGLQIEGGAFAALAANSMARVGVLPAGFRPQRQQFATCVCGELALNSGFGFVRVDPSGDLNTRWTIGNGGMAINAIVALD